MNEKSPPIFTKASHENFTSTISDYYHKHRVQNLQHLKKDFQTEENPSKNTFRKITVKKRKINKSSLIPYGKKKTNIKNKEKKNRKRNPRTAL